jgi:hypothetical protein
MFRLGIILDSEIGVPINAAQGSKEMRMLKVKIGPVTKWIQYIPASGEDIVPPVNSVAIFIDGYDLNFSTATADLMPPDPNMVPGEHKYYGTDGNGNMLGYLYFKHDGKIAMGNYTQSLYGVIYNLEQALNTFASACASASTVANVAAAGSTLVTALANFLTQWQRLFE